MINSTNIGEFLTTLGGAFASIALIITSSITISKKLPILLDIVKKSLVYQFILNAVVLFFFFSTLAAPNGILVWVMVYQIAKNPKQILHPNIFLYVITLITLLVSVYSLLWGLWIVPLLRKPFEKPEI